VQATFLGFKPEGASVKTWLFALTVLVAFGCAIAVQRYLRSGMGFAGEAIRENEIRVEYLGVSARRIIYYKYIVAAVLASLGGGLQAMAEGHVGPDTAYWTTSGEFVFVALLGGCFHLRPDQDLRLPVVAIHVADVARRGAAGSDPVPAEGPVVALRPAAGVAAADRRRQGTRMSAA
jgi:ABC-type branched-subunit amino acid transport system permease subunit